MIWRLLLLALVVVPGIANAQTKSVNRAVTPAEYIRGTGMKQALAPMDVVEENGDPVSVPDHSQSVLPRVSGVLVASLIAQGNAGIQLDPLGNMALLAGKDDLAREQFAARLSSPHISEADRGYTLLLAAKVFGSDVGNTKRMVEARKYLADLDKMPDKFAELKFDGNLTIARSYYLAGNGASALGYLKDAIALVSKIPFERRPWGRLSGSVKDSFILLADILSGQPDGRAQIDSISAWLQQYVRPSAELIAKDSAFYWMGRNNEQQFRSMVQMTDYLGRLAPAITAQYWWNTQPPSPADAASPRATSKRLDDGIIRLIEFGDINCGFCLKALPGMERIRKAMPNGVEVWYATVGHGMWGVTVCTPAEEAKHLEHYYMKRKGYGMPIALWIGPQESDGDGGSRPQKSPTWDALKISAKPTFLVTDGKGIVRHIQVGFSEPLLVKTLKYLVAERNR